MMNYKNVPTPKYFQVAMTLRALITTGELRPSDQIPTEESLCETHGVSRGTVRKAVEMLMEEGLIEREQGRGSFVTTAVNNSNFFSLISFDDEMRRQQRKPSTQLLKFEMHEAGEEDSTRLNLFSMDKVFHIERLRLADGQPVAFERRILAQGLCPDLAHDNLETQSIHWLLTQKYNIPLVRMVHTVERRPLTPTQADLLHATVNGSAFMVDRLTFTTNGTETIPAVLFQAVYREDNYYLQALK
ncbi:MAG: GntR family transcriptional regulator [Chloroflexi bacterium]|nr:GntR family transcriptional regulator [Chloroflexota bacterium]